jgi:predicted helicase
LKEKTPEFADMFAQTIAYGLFAARCNHHGHDSFKRLGAASDIPKTNPFLRKLFETITGTELDDEPFAPFVDDLVQVLDNTDVNKLLAHFGARTKQEDPVVHFYETFLGTYDPKLREARGVFYTPQPVVSYIVRSIDSLLHSHFKLSGGLAETVSTKYTPKGGKKGAKASRDVHKVLILDPACGTGTFLYSLVDYVREKFKAASNAGLWSAYVKHHLLPRIFGFELLMAPYAVAHLKLGLQLAGYDLPPKERTLWAYDFSGSERLGVYLTNTLEQSEPDIQPLLAQLRVISEEANAASEIKRDLPIMVILGNPPYSNFGQMNKGKWISELMADWKPAEETKWNPDDFMKFIRWAQWRIERTGAGVLGFITRNTYLDGLTHRKMRQSLMETFSDIYLLDLHGSLREHDTAPDGGADNNVFDIQWGVSIGLFVRTPGKHEATVRHAEIWGLRDEKYDYLLKHDVRNTNWQRLSPEPPSYYFVPRNGNVTAEYEALPSLPDIFRVKNSGIQTKKDSLTIHLTESSLRSVLKDMKKLDVQELRKRYDLGGDGRDWTVALAKRDIEESKKGKVVQVQYRPFDFRWTYYTGKTKGFVAYPRADVTAHLLKDNISLVSMRQIAGTEDVCEAVVSRYAVTDRSMYSSKGTPYMFPLYLYREAIPRLEDQGLLIDASPYATENPEKVPNLQVDLIVSIEKKLGLRFVPEGKTDLKKTFGAEDLLAYMYAILYSPSYRSRYGEVLRKDYPRIPFTSDVSVFRKLCTLGSELMATHLFESAVASQSPVSFPVSGSNTLDKGYPRYVAPGELAPNATKQVKDGRVYINERQYFSGVSPEVWGFYIGGYQICEKWLKDRHGVSLDKYGDLTHYQRISEGVAETICIMARIDAAIPGWPIA